MKTLMKFHSNGNLEVLEANKLNLGTSGFSFSNNLISIPRIIEYRSGKTMPNWYRYTNAPFSFFKEGIVIKGDLKADVFFDDFNRPNSNSIGNGWVVTSGNFVIKNSLVENGVSAKLSKAYIETNVSDNFMLELGVFIFTRTDGVIFRMQDNENHFQLIYESGNLELAARISNEKSIIANKRINLDRNTRYNIRVDVIGTSIKVLIDNNIELEANSNMFLNATKHGLISYSESASGKFDDFKISILAE